MSQPVIRALAREVADKIAAGEVVERPLSIVKELVENSIDAGSSTITVEIKKGGKEYIRITDNGCGIPKEQLALAFERYATSKIITDEDLNSVKTLGFRGEALASIAAVSKTEMLTKTAEARVGARLTIVGGDIEEISDFACEEGTTIVVSDLFYNTPARKKFLKADNSEASIITDYVSRMALAYPLIRFRMINNGNILFATPGKGDIRNTIATVYSPVTAKNLLELDYAADDAELSLHGFVSKPSESKGSRRQQIFFVNGRWVRSRLMELALDEAFKDKLFEGRFPSAFLFLNLDPKLLDVNIHPNKTDVRFYDEESVRNFMVNAIRRTLRALDAAPSVADLMNAPGKAEKETPKVYEPVRTENTAPVSASEKEERFNDFFSKLRAEKENKTDKSKSAADKDQSSVSNEQPRSLFKENSGTAVKTEQIRIEPKKISSKPESIAPKTQSKTEDKPVSKPDSGEENAVTCFQLENVPKDFSFSDLEIVGQVFATYIVAKDEQYMYLVDQHAAHERILYEKLIKEYNSGKPVSQLMLIPQVISIPPSLKLEAEERLGLLRGLGYSIEEFGPGEVVVKEIPANMSLEEAEEFMNSVIEAETLNRYNTQQKLNTLITRACKSAIKANETLSFEKIRSLFTQLDACENPYSCPHGRPSFIKISEYEMERMFKRK